MQNIEAKSVGEIALAMPVTTRVFEQYKIDYCCGGKTNFVEACRRAGAEPETVARQIEEVLTDGGVEASALLGVSLSDLITYIEDKHHVYTRSEIAALTPLAAKVARVHGPNHPELVELENVFFELCDELLPHLQKEEQVLFPYVRQLERGESKGFAPNAGCFGTVRNPVRVMMSEHDGAGELLRRLRELSNDYTLPEGACGSYTALFARLEAFEKDLHQHIHLENNLLFPRAVELEERMAVEV